MHGWQHVAETMELAATRYRNGKSTGFEAVARYRSADLGAIVEVERYQAKVGGRRDITPVTLRVTSIFRLEDGAWKLVHRHADPISSGQGPESVIQP